MSKVAIVTGSNKGVGFALVRKLCKVFDGVVILTSRDVTRGHAAVLELEREGLDPVFHQLDITDHNSVETLKNHLQTQYGGVDLLVNNAGLAYEFNDSSDAPFGQQAKEVCDTNYFGTLDVCLTLLPLLTPYARLVNVSSMSCKGSFENCSQEIKSRFRNPDLTIEELSSIISQFVESAQTGSHVSQGFDQSAYGMSKIGTSLMCSILQRVFDKQNKRGIVANACCPGLVKTDMSDHIGKTIDQGADTPLYCSLLPENIDSPRGEMISNRAVSDWLSS